MGFAGHVVRIEKILLGKFLRIILKWIFKKEVVTGLDTTGSGQTIVKASFENCCEHRGHIE
jgi:hypothetical protein